MPSYAFKGKSPRVHPTAFVAPTAVLIGDVDLGEHASVWFGTVLRGDMDRIEIGARSNVQDNSTVHTDAGAPVIIGEDVTVGHNALVHSSTVERNVLIGQAAVLIGRCSIGTGTIVAAGAVLPEGMRVPAGKLVAGVPARVLRDARPDDTRWTVEAARHYVELAEWYLEHSEER
ncbi:MAG TPA: gamma carbonic anhydrase family protein [Candidatus Limnocylindria bacterium]